MLLAEVGMDQWTNLSALGALITIMVWGVTKVLPNMFQAYRDESQAQRREFLEEQAASRQEYREDIAAMQNNFREELKAHRDQSKELAVSGHKAVDNLAGKVDTLTQEIRTRFEEKKTE